MSDSLQPHELQHARLPCPSLSPWVCSNSCPLGQWCQPITSSSVAPFLPAFNLSQHQGLLQWVGSSHLVAKKYWSFSISPSNEYSRLISFKIDWLDLLALQGTLKSLLQHHSLKASILWPSAAFMVHLSHLYMTTGKTIALTIWTFVCLVYSHLIIITLDLHFLYCIHFLYASGSLFLCLSFTVCSCFIQIFFTISFYPSGY